MGVLSIVAEQRTGIAEQLACCREEYALARSPPPHFLSTARAGAAAAASSRSPRIGISFQVCGKVLSLFSDHSSAGEECFCWLLVATDRNRLRQMTVATADHCSSYGSMPLFVPSQPARSPWTRHCRSTSRHKELMALPEGTEHLTVLAYSCRTTLPRWSLFQEYRIGSVPASYGPGTNTSRSPGPA